MFFSKNPIDIAQKLSVYLSNFTIVQLLAFLVFLIPSHFAACILLKVPARLAVLSKFPGSDRSLLHGDPQMHLIAIFSEATFQGT